MYTIDGFCFHFWVHFNRPVRPSFFWYFLTAVVAVRISHDVVVPFAEGQRGWVMLVVVSSAHNNVLLGMAAQCCFF